MKYQSLILTAVLASAAVFATSSYAAECTGECPKAQKPAPISVVQPTNLPLRFEGATIEIELTIDEDGVPHNVRAARWMPSDLAKVLIPTIEQWRFTPQYKDGKPVTTRVILPIKLEV